MARGKGSGMSVDWPGYGPSENANGAKQQASAGPLVGGVLDPMIIATQRPWRLRPSSLKGLCVVTDVVGVAAGLLAAYAFTTNIHLLHSLPPRGSCLVVGLISLPLWVLVFSRYRLYKARFTNSRLDELNRLSHAVLASVLLLGALSFVFRLPVARSWTLASFFFVLVFVWLSRQMLRGHFRRLRSSGALRKRVLIVGVNEESEKIYTLLEADPALGYEVLGLLGEPNQRPVGKAKVVGTINDAMDVARAQGAQGVIVASSAITSATTNRLARELTEVGLHVELSSSLWDIGYERLTVQPVGFHPMIYVEPVLRTGWRPLAKRAFDLTAASLAFLVFFPLLVLIAVLIKLDTRGPVLFRQVRVGRDERPFRVLKFRSMVADAEELLLDLRTLNEADGPLFKLRKDPRVTRVGRMIRKYSLDELPQLVNVLAGHMSVVGPRPALYEEMHGWTSELRTAKLRVRPGLTGIWQVSGRSNLSFEDYVRLDLFYVYNWNLWRDLSILARTVPVVLNSDGAY